MKAQVIAIAMMMLLGSILVVGIADGNNSISEVDWGNASPANMDELVKHISVSEQNSIVLSEKIKGYQELSTDGVWNFTHGTIKQAVVNENGTVAIYYDLSAEDQFIWSQNITTYRFVVNDADSTIETDKLAIFIFYKDCKPVGYAWGYVEQVKITPTYIPNMSCVAGQVVAAPTDSSGGGGPNTASAQSAPSAPSSPSGPSGPANPGAVG